VGLADNAAGGQIHLPTVSNTINSEPTNIDNQLTTSGRALPRTAAPACVLWRANAELEPGNNCIKVGKLPVGRLVGRNLPSTFYLLFFNCLG
jgi:hypothetical protein